MLKRGLWLMLVVFLVSGLMVWGAEVEEEVLEEFGEGEEKVGVIVELKEDVRTGSEDLEERKEGIKERQEEVLKELNLEEKKRFLGLLTEEKEFELGHQYATINAFSGEITEEGLRKLEKDPGVEKIFFNKVLHPTLTTSVPQINADEVWNLSVGGYNITGIAETVCVLDTGIDTDHSAFTGRILDQYCYCGVSDYGAGGCCPDNTNESTSAEDGQGHGTHVAGIAVGNHSKYRGVAPEAGIIAIKVCDNAAQASCGSADVIAGIEWCTNNASKYNISVISMSLGDGQNHTTYCNSDVLAPAINTAVKVNISVVIAAGNEGYTNGINSPACVENATPVGGVDSSDSIVYNRGDILDLLAPGVGIVAPTYDGGTGSKSGTSMSAPHVSGGIALFRQYWRLAYNLVPGPASVEYKFKITGKLIDDSGSSGRDYSRIDALKGVQPFVNFTADSVANGTNQSVTFALINVSSDVNLTGALLEWDSGNGTVENVTMNEKNVTSFYYNITGLVNGTHNYKVYGNDSANTFGTSEERTLEVDQEAPNITINYPANNSYHNSGFDLNVSITNVLLDGSSYNITNASGDIIQENSNLSIGTDSFEWIDLVNVSNSSFADDNYSLAVFANDSFGNSAEEEAVFVVDKTVPGLLGFDKSPAIVYNNETVVFYVNVTDTNRNDTGILIEGNWTGSFVNYTMSLESGERFSYSLDSGNLSNQERVGYWFYGIDLAGNVNSSSLYNFTVQNRNISLVNITNPANGTVIEAGNWTQFNGTADDPDNDTLSYSWDFGDGTSSAEQNPLKAFNTTGDFVVVLNVSDGYGSVNLTNITVVVNDTLGPKVTSISYDSSVHIESEGNQTVKVTVFDYSGIFNVTLYFNETIKKEGACTESNTSWSCNWSWNFTTHGSYNFTVNMTDNFSVKHDNFSTYSFSVTSCSDGVQNGDEGGADCGGSCASACPTGDGGGGAGAGAAVTTVCTVGAISCMGTEQYKECLKEGTVNKWSEVLEVPAGKECKFGALVEIEEVVEEEEEEVVEIVADIDFSITAEASLNIKVGESKTFSLDGVTTHSLMVDEVTETTATITISSDPITLTLGIGETKEVDVDKDGINDLSVTLSSIKEGVAGLVIKKIEEVVLPEEIEVVPEEKVSLVGKAFGYLTGMGLKEIRVKEQVLIGMGVLLVFLLVVYFVLRRREVD